VYVIVAVPSPTEVTTPNKGSTVATAVLLLLHVPLGDPLSLNCAVLPPEHNGVFPTITTGGAFTVTVVVAVPVNPFASVIVKVYT
jgi:hypothetical protein